MKELISGKGEDHTGRWETPSQCAQVLCHIKPFSGSKQWSDSSDLKRDYADDAIVIFNALQFQPSKGGGEKTIHTHLIALPFFLHLFCVWRFIAMY